MNACKTSINGILKDIPQERQYQSPSRKKKTSSTLHKEIKNQDPNDLVTKDVIEAFSKAAKDIHIWFSVVGLDPYPSDKEVTGLMLLKFAFNDFCPQLDAVLDAISKKLNPNTSFSPLYWGNYCPALLAQFIRYLFDRYFYTGIMQPCSPLHFAYNLYLITLHYLITLSRAKHNL